ncbi:MAG: shikimate dehydrogenase [Thermoflexus sp.]|uniref:shikimate dehydrogenase n=1 Tax=Thermoflexus sp. TaxID=1969742 RepID=UPI003323E9CD
MEIRGTTRLVGLMGWPVAHSRSPQMHNAAFAALGLDWAYVPLPVRPEDLEAAIRGLRALGFVGANVTVPHKMAVLSYLDEISPLARAVGAVNTLRFVEGRLIGENTDVDGFRAALAEAGCAVRGQAAAILGAGGAARAVLAALALEGAAEIFVVHRSVERAARMVAELAEGLSRAGLTVPPVHWRSPSDPLPEDIALLVNATPVGMAPEVEASPWPPERPFPWGLQHVIDLIYEPPRTRLMALAEAAGIAAHNGLGMLLHQGARAFFLWTGREPPLEVMRRALEGGSPAVPFDNPAAAR